MSDTVTVVPSTKIFIAWLVVLILSIVSLYEADKFVTVICIIVTQVLAAAWIVMYMCEQQDKERDFYNTHFPNS